MPCSRRNQNSVSRHNQAKLPIDLHQSITLQKKIKFFTLTMKMPIRCSPLRQIGLGEALIFDRGIGKI